MYPLIATTALSMATSFLSSSKQRKAEQAAAARANALATEQRQLADNREAEAMQNNTASINTQRLSDLTNINFATQQATSNAVASTAGSGLSGTSISDLSTQVMIDSAADVARVNREANDAIVDQNLQLRNARANRAIEAKYSVNGSTTNVGSNVLNAGLQTFAGGLMNLKF